MRENSEVSVDTVGLLGLGLMGRGIAACLLCHGRKVVAYNRSRGRAEKARTFLAGVMEEVVRRGVFSADAVADWAERFTVVDAISGLAECPFVAESVKEDIELKRRLYAELEQQIAPDAVIASNTSSFPLTLLQAWHWGQRLTLDRQPASDCNLRASCGLSFARVFQSLQHAMRTPAIVVDSAVENDANRHGHEVRLASG